MQAMTHAEFIEENYWKSESPIHFIFGLGTAMAFVVGVVIVYQGVSTDVNAHLKEYATFSMMEATTMRIYLLWCLVRPLFLQFWASFLVLSLPLGSLCLAAQATALPFLHDLREQFLVLILT